MYRCKSCSLGGLRKRLGGLGGLRAANGSLEPPEKQMAGACIDVRVVALEGHVYSCKSCCHGRVGSVWGVVRVVATGGLEAFGGFEAGKTAVLNPLKTGWQGHV